MTQIDDEEKDFFERTRAMHEAQDLLDRVKPSDLKFPERFTPKAKPAASTADVKIEENKADSTEAVSTDEHTATKRKADLLETEEEMKDEAPPAEEESLKKIKSDA